jgi:hypothetical protein
VTTHRLLGVPHLDYPMGERLETQDPKLPNGGEFGRVSSRDGLEAQEKRRCRRAHWRPRSEAGYRVCLGLASRTDGAPETPAGALATQKTR